MAIDVVRLGTPRGRGEALRLGTVRRPPRGVKKADWAKDDWFDVWLPELSPSAELVSWALGEPWTDRRWRMFASRYRKEMNAPAAQHLLALLVAMAAQTSFAVGCYCEDGSRCHRAVLAELLRENGAEVRIV